MYNASNNKYFLLSLNELEQYFSNDTMIVVFYSELAEQLGVTIFNNQVMEDQQGGGRSLSTSIYLNLRCVPPRPARFEALKLPLHFNTESCFHCFSLVLALRALSPHVNI